MGLVKTVFSPLTSTTPLVSIILILILIVVFRLSGGGISDTEPKHFSKKNLPSENTDLSQNTSKNKPLKDFGTITIKADELKELMRRKPKKATNEEEKPRERRGNFDEIEEELGLR